MPSKIDDRELFRKFVGEIQPLKSNRIHIKNNNKPKPVPKKRVHEPEPGQGNPQFEILTNLSISDSLCYVGPGLQKRVLRRLKRGYFEIEAELDLHGLTAREAKRLLANFLNRCTADRLRCIHIIHGRGYRSSGQIPILKNKLNLWLRQHLQVLAFCSSSPADGGTGAVYVLLRR